MQVTKEPISTKGCRVTAQISLPGRFLVYMPYASKVGVSRKIESRELRSRLREMVNGLLPKDSGGDDRPHRRRGSHRGAFQARGRFAAAPVEEDQPEGDLRPRPPALVQRETSLTRGIIRDLFSAKVDALHVDSKELYNEVEQYLEPDRSRADVPGHDVHGTGLRCSTSSMSKTKSGTCSRPAVDLPTGGYIVIQPTEALVSIDVNTGRYTGKKDPEKTILKTNLEAAREIARQIRLRDIGGIIVCDFIDMESRQNRDRVLQELRSHLGRDRARTKAFAVSELGLVEMTRQRVRPSLWHSMTTECPACAGTGRVFTPEAVARRLERSLKRAGTGAAGAADRGPAAPGCGALPPRGGAQADSDALRKATGLELELRDDPMMRLDEFRLMSRPAGRDVTELYAVA